MALLATSTDGALAIVSAVSITAGYGLLWALWHYVFRPSREHDDQRDRARSER